MPYTSKRDRADAQARYRDKMSAVVTDAKKVGCADCGESDPVVLDFHHRDPSQKLFNIGTARGKSVPKVVAEIAKCDVVCANCHRRREANMVDVVQSGQNSGS